MDDEYREIENGDILIEGNIIKKIGKKLKVRADNVIDATDRVVVPGFVNTHHHLYQSLNRNLPRVQDAELFDWLVELYEVWRELTPEAVYYSTLVGMGELLLTGTTTTTDQFYVFPEGKPAELIDEQIRAAKEIGMRFTACRGSMSLGRSKGGLPPDDVVQTPDEIRKDEERLINKYHDPSFGSMIQIALAPCSPFSVTREQLAETACYARQKGVRIHTHLAETIDEENYCKEKFGMRPFDYMESVGWLGPDVWFAHSVWVNSDEIKRMAKTGTGVAHCPTSNLRLGSGIAPVPEMLECGVPVGLAVDGSASNDSSDMLGEIRMALMVHRVKSGISSMTARRALKLATMGGARVLGRKDIGSLEEGKCADLAIFDVSGLPFAGSLHDPVAALVFSGASHIADTVIVNGEIVVRNGMLITVDEEKIAEEANRIAGLMVRTASRKRGVDYTRPRIKEKKLIFTFPATDSEAKKEAGKNICYKNKKESSVQSKAIGKKKKTNSNR